MTDDERKTTKGYLVDLGQVATFLDSELGRGAKKKEQPVAVAEVKTLAGQCYLQLAIAERLERLVEELEKARRGQYD